MRGKSWNGFGLCDKVRPREVGDTYELNTRSDPSLKIVNSKLLFLEIEIFYSIKKKDNR